MKKLSGFLALSFLLSACSVYKSQNKSHTKSLSHKSFENTACENISAFQYWYETRFPSPHAHLIESSNDIEIWQVQKDEGSILQTFEQTNGFITRCILPFSSPQDLQNLKNPGESTFEGETT